MPTIKQALRESPITAPLLPHAEEHQAIKALISAVLPSVVSLSYCRLKIADNKLSLIVKSNAVAAKLRQLQPTIAAQLEKNGRYFEQIHIVAGKSQAISSPLPLFIAKPELTKQTVEHLLQLSTRLSHLPKASQALNRIAKKLQDAE